LYAKGETVLLSARRTLPKSFPIPPDLSVGERTGVEGPEFDSLGTSIVSFKGFAMLETLNSK
jgi:hypothetical protein